MYSRMGQGQKKTQAQKWVLVAGLTAGMILLLVVVGTVVVVLFSPTESSSREEGGAADDLRPADFPTTTTSPSESPVMMTLSPSQSAGPSFEPSGTYSPSQTFSDFPSHVPSLSPSHAPSASLSPTKYPSLRPTSIRSAYPSYLPTVFPTNRASTKPQITTFYAIGDVPYSDRQAERLSQQMSDLPLDAEFLIHVGDLRDSSRNQRCRLSDYEDAAALLRKSHAPVFVILGDNDWTDCPNQDEGLQYWKDTFIRFEGRYWNHTFNIERMPGRLDNFAFEHKGTLFMGLNIVGGDVHSNTEWSSRLTDEVEWTMQLIRNYQTRYQYGGRVVIFGHANPNQNHRKYFDVLTSFLENEIENKIPILYINGDKHEWLYEPNFYDQPSFLRVMVSGRARDPPLKVTVNANGNFLPTKEAFVVDRRKEW